MDFNRELPLSVSKKSWKMSSTHGTEYDKNFKNSKGELSKIGQIWSSVWERDKFSCYYCGFKSKRFQEIHHLNDNHEDNSEDNLVTVCPLCHQNFHLDIASTTGGGKIIWLPEFSQQELNYLCRSVFIAIDESDEKEGQGVEVPGFAKISRMIENSFSERALVVEQQFQSGASDPAIFATALLNLKEEDYNNRFSLLKSFKLLHFKARFPIQTKYWRTKVFVDLPVNTWEKLIRGGGA